MWCYDWNDDQPFRAPQASMTEEDRAPPILKPSTGKLRGSKERNASKVVEALIIKEMQRVPSEPRTAAHFCDTIGRCRQMVDAAIYNLMDEGFIDRSITKDRVYLYTLTVAGRVR
jgi:hypothetical protein